MIGIDLRCLPPDGDSGAGIAHAARAVSCALLAQSKPGIEWSLYLPRGVSWGMDGRSDLRIISLSSSAGASLRLALQRSPCDLLFVPSGAVARGIRIPAVPWVHDVAIFEHPEWFGESILRRAVTTSLFRRGIVHAPRILAASQSTKDDLVQLFTLDPSVVDVTYEGGDPVLASLYGDTLRDAKRRAKLRLADRGVTQPFVLVLGTVEPRKNLPLLIHAWSAAVKDIDRPVDLIIAGRDGWKLGPATHAMRGHVYASEGSPRLHRIKAVPEDDRRDLLLSADIVTVPSLHEGFGLVALEAMQAETAVLASRAGALPEVIDTAGILLSSTDEVAWADALRGIFMDTEARKRLAEEGKARSQGMTWGRAAHFVLESLTKTLI